MSKEDKNYTVVLGRQFGCGGREIGRRVAELLGISYFDKELLHEASRNSGVSAEIFEAADERSPSFFANPWSFGAGFPGNGTFFTGSSSPLDDENIYRAQSEVIIDIAKKGPCVIVGRTADFLLRDITNVISIFIHSSLDDRAQRIVQRGDCKTIDEAKEMAVKKNKLRASYYNFYTNLRWGDAANYHLTIDSTQLGTEATAQLIAHYVRQRTSPGKM